MKEKIQSGSVLPFFCFLFFFLLSPAQPVQCHEIYVSSPWLSLVAGFIGGMNITVKPIQEWNAEGTPLRKIRPQNIPGESKIVALDTFEASSLGLDGKRFHNLFLLYGKVPFDRSRIDYHFFDPSVLPFIAQRMLTALSQFDPENYSYYQRRLSEFQTRLDSTVIVGRQLLKDSPVFDLSGGFSSLLSAAGCTLLPDDRNRRDQWNKGEDLEGMRKEITDATNRRIPVIADASTSKPVREALKGNKDILYLGRPGQDQDLLLFFHDQFLLLWNRLAPLRQIQEEKKN